VPEEFNCINYRYINYILIVGPSILQYRSKMTNKCVEIVVGFIDTFLDFSQHVSASDCHHQEGRSALEATQVRSVLWMCMDYDSSGVVSCPGMQLHLLVILLRY
jgi:hypothetical protein